LIDDTYILLNISTVESERFEFIGFGVTTVLAFRSNLFDGQVHIIQEIISGHENTSVRRLSAQPDS